MKGLSIVSRIYILVATSALLLVTSMVITMVFLDDAGISSMRLAGEITNSNNRAFSLVSGSTKIQTRMEALLREKDPDVIEELYNRYQDDVKKIKKPLPPSGPTWNSFSRKLTR